MQYILTEEEYKQLKMVQKHQIELSKEKLQELCTKIADTMPIVRPWAKDEPASPWGCIHTEEWEHYCDECPVETICPSYKNFSQ